MLAARNGVRVSSCACVFWVSDRESVKERMRASLYAPTVGYCVCPCVRVRERESAVPNLDIMLHLGNSGGILMFLASVLCRYFHQIKSSKFKINHKSPKSDFMQFIQDSIGAIKSETEAVKKSGLVEGKSGQLTQ